MGKKITEVRTDEPKAMSKLTSRILEKVDIDKLADSVADQIGNRIMSEFAITTLVDRLLQKVPRRTANTDYRGNR